MELLLFIIVLCVFVGFAVYVMARPDAPPNPDEPDTEPPSDFLPDITTRTDRELWNAINKGVEK